MKKVIAIMITLALMLCFSMTAFAADNGGFTVSPSGNLAPELVEVKTEEGEPEVAVEIVSYAEREKLPAYDKAILELAYEQISETADLTDISNRLKTLAEEKGLNPENLAVSDLFDISAEVVEGADDHGKVTITLKAETLQNFTALLHFRNGAWEVVDDAAVAEDGKTMTFSVNDFSPFAIVVDTTEPEEEGGVNGATIAIFVTLLATSVIATAVSAKKSKE